MLVGRCGEMPIDVFSALRLFSVQVAGSRKQPVKCRKPIAKCGSVCILDQAPERFIAVFQHILHFEKRQSADSIRWMIE